MTYIELKDRVPVAAALLRQQMPHSFHGQMQHLWFWFDDGDLYADHPDLLPEAIVLPACSKIWEWESEL